MSGIFAIFRRDGRAVHQSDIEGARSALAAYGRVYCADRFDGPVAFLYTHACFVPEALSEKQPIEGGDGRFVMVFDGRLDNRNELDLPGAARDGAQTSVPDSALAMACWERWGTDAPARLIGDFALIVWDKAEQRLFAARDHFGMRPLSYHATVDRIVLSTTPHALFAAGNLPKRIDRQKMADILVGNYRDGARSYFDGVARVPPAHILTVDRTNQWVQRYWSLDRSNRVHLPRDEDYVEQAGELLDRSVGARMRSSVSIGSEITGGLDSSTLAVTALKFLPAGKDLPVFTLVPERNWDGLISSTTYGDETPYVADIARMHPRLKPHFLPLDGLSIDAGIDDRLRTMSTIPRAPIAGTMWSGMYRAAAAAGVKVMLNGSMGNLSLTWDGREIYPEMLRAGRLPTLAREIRAVSTNPIQFVRRFLGLAVLPVGPAWLRRLHATINGNSGTYRTTWQSHFMINPDFARDMRVDERARQLGWGFLKTRWNLRQTRADLLTTDMMLEMGDLYAGFEALHGIQNRLPLLDLRLVEWCLALPTEQYFRNGRSRWLVKRLMEGRLPPDVLANRKDGSQIADWHGRMSRDLVRLREELEVMASDPDVAEVIDVPRLLKLIDTWPPTPPGYQDESFFHLQIALPHALTVSRLIRQVKGANL